MMPLPPSETVTPAPSRERRALRGCAVVALFVALTALMAYPLSVAPADRAVNMGADTRLFLWTLAWDLHALVHQPFAIFDANIFFPERHTLAYSENLFGVALLVAPWLAVTGDPLLAMNVAALLSCVLSGLGAYALARRLEIGVAGAIVAGVIFAFSPPRFWRLGQLHLTSVQWIPFSLSFLHVYLERGERRHLLAAAAFFTLQALSSGHGAVFLAVSTVALVSYHAVVTGSFSWRKLVRDLGLGGVLLLSLNAPFAWPYLEVKHEMGFERSLADAEHGSPNAVSYLASPTHLHRFLLSLAPAAWAVNDAEAFLFPGYLTLILAAVALRRRPVPGGPRSAPERGESASRIAVVLELGAPLAARARFERWRTALRSWSARRCGTALGFYVLLAVLTLWASLGPRFGLYALLYHVPGFSFIRIPSRIMIVTLLSLSVLAGAGFDRVADRWAFARRPWFAVVLLGLLLAELAAFPIKARPYVVEIPAVDRWLARQPQPFAIAEVPVLDPDRNVRSDRIHSLYMLHSMAHCQKTVSGYSGFLPLRHVALFRSLMRFPDEVSLRALRDLHVGYVVVHRDLYPPGEVEAADQRFREWGDWLALQYSEGEGRVYSLREPATVR